MNIPRSIKSFAICGLLLPIVNLGAKEGLNPVFEVRFEYHNFSPRSLILPAGQPVRIKIVNSSSERIEFESFKLNREKVVEPGKTATVNLPPLKAGSYDFFDDFHADVPEGEIIAR